jgi:hypothetical protein
MNTFPSWSTTDYQNDLLKYQHFSTSVPKHRHHRLATPISRLHALIPSQWRCGLWQLVSVQKLEYIFPYVTSRLLVIERWSWTFLKDLKERNSTSPRSFCCDAPIRRYQQLKGTFFIFFSSGPQNTCGSKINLEINFYFTLSFSDAVKSVIHKINLLWPNIDYKGIIMICM